MRRRAAVATVLLAGLAITVLAGCSNSETVNNADSSSDSSTASPTKKPVKAPTFVVDGSASDNEYYFSWVMEQALAADPEIDSPTMAQRVAETEFGNPGIQYTFTRTAIGLAADSIFVAVPSAGECLVGQFGPQHDGVSVDVLPALASGGCLLGSSIQTLG